MSVESDLKSARSNPGFYWARIGDLDLTVVEIDDVGNIASIGYEGPVHAIHLEWIGPRILPPRLRV